jgi:lipopolysaccharide transport system ATP-binding protein
MSSGSPAIRLTDVSKRYTVYSQPKYWLADFLGLGWWLREGRHYRSIWALRDINLEIPQGGKFALVGRNGAGKSTLLRIVSENINPTTGKVEVDGRAEALLQLGAGFNPDFTGMQNIFTALAYMGINAKDARQKVQDILDFSELDEFIDQPVRTYSSGMYLRLAFSVATVIAPRILIIDEIFGAGDMYFRSKCLARIKELASGRETTVLFATHDLEFAQRFCEDFIWLERGRIVAQGPSAEIRALYEDSVRKQQQAALRARNLRLTRQTTVALQEVGGEGVHLMGQLVMDPAEGGISGPAVSGIRLYVNGELSERIAVGDALDDDTKHYRSFVLSDPDESCWSPPRRRGERLCRIVAPTRDGARGAKFALFLSHHDAMADESGIELEVVYQDIGRVPCHLELNLGMAGLKSLLTLEHAADRQWKTVRVPIPRWAYASHGGSSQARTEGEMPGRAEAVASAPQPVPAERRFGTGQVVIERVRFLDAHGIETSLFTTGQEMSIVVQYRTRDTALVGTTMLCAVGFERLDGVVATTPISTVQDQRFPVNSRGTLRVTFEPLLLTTGGYRLSVVLFSEHDLHGYNANFTRNDQIYDMHRLAYQIAVEGTYRAEYGLFRAPVRWSSEPIHSSPESADRMGE